MYVYYWTEASHWSCEASFWMSSSNQNSYLNILRKAELFQATSASVFSLKSARNILNAEQSRNHQIPSVAAEDIGLS